MILAVSQVLALAQYGPELMLYGLAKHGSIARLMAVIGLIHLVLSLLFVQVWGIYGAALGSAIPLALGQTIFVPVLVRRFMGLDLRLYVQKAVIPTLLPGTVFALALWAATALWPVGSWLALFQAAFISSLAYVPAAFLAALDRDEKARVRAMVRSRLTHLPTLTRPRD